MSKQEITEKIKSFEDACQVLCIKPDSVIPVFSINMDAKIQKSSIAFVKLATIVKALNEGWEPDWTNHDQYKYFPWFRMDSAGFAYASTNYSVAYTYANFGSRLGFKTDALCDYAKEQFKELYVEYLF